jgi:crossover junction endodeoxyribonuclease RuvC
MRVLGLDPGSRRTGWGVVEKTGNRLHCVAHGTVAPGARLGLPQRLHVIASRVGELMESMALDTVVVEEAFYHESVRSTLVLGHVRGALLVAAVARGLPVVEYSPREIKMSVTGSGAAAKEQVAFMVRRMLDVRGAVQMDASDALAAALCHLQRARLSAPARAASIAAQRLQALLATRGSR